MALLIVTLARTKEGRGARPIGHAQTMRWFSSLAFSSRVNRMITEGSKIQINRRVTGLLIGSYSRNVCAGDSNHLPQYGISKV